MRPYDAVFFDLDGTVVDTLQDIVDAVNHTMRRFGLPEYSREQLRPILGYGVGPLMRRILPPDLPDDRRAALIEYYQGYYALHSGDKSQPFDGVLPMMARLRAEGLKLAILSNKPDAALQPLAQRFFTGLSDLSAGERAGVRRKPDPDMLERAADELGVDLRRCLYVGDSEVDIDTAANAGIDCVCVSWGFRTREALRNAGATVIVDAPEALIDCALAGRQV